MTLFASSADPLEDPGDRKCFLRFESRNCAADPGPSTTGAVFLAEKDDIMELDNTCGHK